MDTADNPTATGTEQASAEAQAASPEIETSEPASAPDEFTAETAPVAGDEGDEADTPGPASSEDGAREPVDVAQFARDLLDQILQAMGVPAAVTGESQPDGSVRLLVEGSDMGVVIGKHGGTINALQYLISLILQKRVGERVRLVIDAEGYRSRREQALRDMAHTYAQRVRDSGQEAVLDALQSYERRIIHNCLADDPDVFTYSEGEEPDRRVVISPREASEPA
jgi:spoIIIJ-associated protein